MKTIAFDPADSQLTWTAVVDALDAGHREAKPSIGDLLIGSGENSLLTRTAWIEGFGIALKSMSVFPGNPRADPPRPSVQGSMLLFDPETGAPSALIDGPLVTKWKTVGDSLLGARLLANPKPKTLLVCGAGTVAAHLVEGYPALFPTIETILVWNRTTKRAEQLVDAASGGAVTICVAADLEAAAGEADIVTCATLAKEPFLKGAWLKAGAHVDLIGAYTPQMREADDTVLSRGELFVDSRQTTIGHIGEIQIPLDEGAITRDDIRGDLYDLVAGKAGRSGPDAITVFKNGGGAHLDLMVGRLIEKIA
ncbi:ornithine cyclodeaminase [Jiella sp. MQZ9-1]|uniref:Ornithine cyclodeaminase n=1 Tax=Jiella flava TaxID=2816857 RepID=A0A939FT19_9HYPH|nr:ornithine cyclodeaminase [Jiella flava]MBO0661403.1 ornithine cyclodeaminase [Jiella flava]MCD2470047.1 ornithine cyclodeaminase [Jiella flava]